MEAAARSMARLNRRAAELMVEFDAHACTDITGFGLIGHLKSMARASNVTVEILWDDVPLLPGVLQYAANGILPGGIERNREASGDALAAVDGVDPAAVEILFDAQTSGGLMVALPEQFAAGFVRRLHAEGIVEAAVIGRVMDAGAGRILVRGESRRQMPVADRRQLKTACCSSAAEERKETPAHLPSQENSRMSCCSDDRQSHGHADTAAGADEIRGKFQEFLAVANAPGLLGARTKRAMAIALSVLSRCSPCVKHHVAKAAEEGFSPQEIDEAAWMGIAFGGSPAMMFYNENKKNKG
jgi:AhpD family alkylhydroperoxidase